MSQGIHLQNDIDAVHALLLERRHHPEREISFRTISRITGVPESTVRRWEGRFDELDEATHERWIAQRGPPTLLSDEEELILAG